MELEELYDDAEQNLQYIFWDFLYEAVKSDIGKNNLEHYCKDGGIWWDRDRTWAFENLRSNCSEKNLRLIVNKLGDDVLEFLREDY